MLEKIDLENKLIEISKILEHNGSESSQTGVLSGVSGVSLFFFYYAKYRNDNKYAEMGNRLLEESLNRISEGNTFPTYCSGIAGVGWVLEHLAEEEFIEVENDELLPELEDHLYLKMKQDSGLGHYDFLHGAIGYGLYFLKRFRNTSSPRLKSKYESYLRELLQSLQDNSEKDEHGLKWPSEIKLANQSKRVYNLSLSHGLSSIINFLSRICEFREFHDLGLPILEGSVGYMLAQEESIGSSLFPSLVSKTPEKEMVESRLAWCYGDLGIGISLYRASQVLKRPRLEEDAMRILQNTTLRKDIGQCGVVDASPCHGAFGIASMYQMLFESTGISTFKGTAEYWLAQGLALAVHADGYAGYKQYHPEKPSTNETSVLEGIAGIGLVIISALSGFSTSWEECLLIK